MSAVNGGQLFSFVSPEYALSKYEMGNACFSRPCISEMQSVSVNCQCGEFLYFYCSIECTDEVMRLLRCVSGRLRCVFGASWGIFERLGGVFEESWRRLGGVLERLWSDMEALWSFLSIF